MSDGRRGHSAALEIPCAPAGSRTDPRHDPRRHWKAGPEDGWAGIQLLSGERQLCAGLYTEERITVRRRYRRMVYGTVVRQRPDGVFGVFDCPDGGQIAPKRTRSTTPLQALNLLNSGFIMQQANFFAERLEKEAGQDAKAQARRAFALAFQREADNSEIEASVTLIREQGLPVFLPRSLKRQ